MGRMARTASALQAVQITLTRATQRIATDHHGRPGTVATSAAGTAVRAAHSPAAVPLPYAQATRGELTMTTHDAGDSGDRTTYAVMAGRNSKISGSNVAVGGGPSGAGGRSHSSSEGPVSAIRASPERSKATIQLVEMDIVSASSAIVPTVARASRRDHRDLATTMAMIAVTLTMSRSTATTEAACVPIVGCPKVRARVQADAAARRAAGAKIGGRSMAPLWRARPAFRLPSVRMPKRWPGEFTFCPMCATELEQRALSGRDRSVCPQCGYIHWRNPGVGAAVVVRDRRGRVLLIRRAGGATRPGFWAIPAGYVDYGEDVREAAQREMREETGLTVEVGDPVFVASNFHDPAKLTVGIWFSGRVVGGVLQAGDDADDAAYFDLDDLPPLAFETDQVLLDRLRDEQA